MENLKNNRRKIDENGVTISCALFVLNCLVGGFFFLIIWLFSSLEDLYSPFLGDNAILILFIAGFICALSPIYLLFIKRNHIRILAAYSIIILFVVFNIIFSAAATNYFKDFTKEKWLDHPQVRNLMLDDLEKNHGIIGMDKDGVIDLLGVPDSNNDRVFAYYMHKVNRGSVFIQVNFLEGTVATVASINYINVI